MENNKYEFRETFLKYLEANKLNEVHVRLVWVNEWMFCIVLTLPNAIIFMMASMVKRNVKAMLR